MLTTKTILGAGWAVSSRMAGRLVDFVTLLVLARALSPADFGLTAIATTLISIVDTVLEVPLILALTSLNRITKAHLDTAFTLGVIRGSAFSLVVLAAAWPFAHIYGDNRLMALVATLAIGPVARSLYSPAMVNYIRDMSFRQGFIAEFAGKTMASAIGISVALFGGGYWAIVAASVSSNLANTLLSYVIAPYRPRLSLAEFPAFATFLGWFSSAQLFSALSWQFDRILLGYYVTKSNLGQYSMASDLSVLPTQSLIGPAMQPLVSAFARINDSRERLRRAYSKASRFTMTLAAPACIGMSVTSDLLISVLLGAKWTEAAVYLQWLALSVVLNAFYQPLHSLAVAMNRTKLIFRLCAMELCFRIVLMTAGLYFYSIMGVIIARVAVSFVMFILSLISARYLIGIKVTSELANLWEVGAACAAMALFTIAFRHQLDGLHLPAFAELGMTAAFGALVYAGALFGFGVRVKDFVVRPE
jgi:O-antigen/teichoic acid export membrane protein